MAKRLTALMSGCQASFQCMAVRPGRTLVRDGSPDPSVDLNRGPTTTSTASASSIAIGHQHNRNPSHFPWLGFLFARHVMCVGGASPLRAVMADRRLLRIIVTVRRTCPLNERRPSRSRVLAGEWGAIRSGGSSLRLVGRPVASSIHRAATGRGRSPVCPAGWPGVA